LVRIKRIGGKWLISPASVWDKEGALIPVPQAELKVREGFLYFVVDATFHFSQPESHQFGSFSQRSSGGLCPLLSLGSTSWGNHPQDLTKTLI
jgi:hypothetical protein